MNAASYVVISASCTLVLLSYQQIVKSDKADSFLLR